MKKYILLLLFIAFGTTVKAQVLKGKIKNQTGEGIAFANISVLNKASGTIADKDGNYTIRLPKGNYELLISAVGYANVLRKVSVQKENSELVVELKNASLELGEVIVTAQKSEQSALKTPVAVTSISSQKIEDAKIWDLSSLTSIVPNYLYQELGVAFQQIQSIRGIQVFSENPAVATYVDDVNALDILANGFQLTDIERIEVLRGPQGTLFGRNAMGGVVNIITKKPTNKTSGSAEMSFGNLGLQRYSLSYKTPIVKDKLFFGLSTLFQTKNGYLTNDTTGTNATLKNIQGARVGDEKNLYGNAYLKWIPNSKFSATLNLKAQSDWSDATTFMLSVASEKIAFANPDKIYLSRIGSHKRNILNSSLSLKYFGNAYTLTSISALQNIAMSYKDVDFPGYYHSFREKEIGELLPPQKVFSQEVRINSNNLNSKLNYSAGIYYFNQTGYEPTTNLAYELAPDMYSVFRNVSKNNGIAIFGQATYSLTGNLDFTAGLRYESENRKSIFNGFGDAIFTGGVLTLLKPDTTVSGKYTALSPKLALTYSLSKAATLYASYTKGFRAGGVNASKLPNGVDYTFKPEYSNNFEVGFKTQTLNNKLSLSVTAFHISWKDLQFYNLVAPFTYARENVGDAQSQGVEVEASIIPAKNFEIDASLGVNMTEYKEFSLKRVDFSTFQEVRTAIGGNKLSNAPSSSLFLAGQYSLPVDKKNSLILRAEVRNIGSYYTDIQNTLKQNAYSLVNLRLSFVAPKFNISLWGQNLTNERYLAYGSGDTSFGRSSRIASPRTFGISLSTKF